MISKCTLCPRRCAAFREQGQCGFCGAGDGLRIFRWGPHFGEEPPLIGENGSGCIFFSRCTMRCCYCQNSPWSWRGGGEDVSIPRLMDIMRSLALENKCANWNLVSPTPYLPFIREAARLLREEGVRLPFVWNSSGYEDVETLKEYGELLDIALFDLRYARDETALKASATSNYVKASRAALKYAWEHLGALDDGTKATRGTICRILVLPGHAEEALENLAWIATELSNEVSVSIMSQFTPVFKALTTPPFNRTITEEEYALVTEAAADFGFENGWIQGFESHNPQAALLGENMSPGPGVVRDL